ncbi:fibrinogen C domain-containing protein 1-like [Zophobas morio]|uniref:fibrinogen C domain-containing protein 1-like n=1 Tax=Zophobas morio TaxID=2755281 RepID=UPI00308368AC
MGCSFVLVWLFVVLCGCQGNFVSSTVTPDTEHEKVDLEFTIREIYRRLENLDRHYAENNRKTDTIPENCLEVKKRGNNVTGIFLIKPEYASAPFLALCDMITRGGGWTVILNRFDGCLDFYLGWQNYKNGFGNLAGEFWLGLEKIHQLSGFQVNELLVELVDSGKTEVYAGYKHFSVSNEVEGYNLQSLAGFSGTAGDFLSHQAGMKFTTKDKDNDIAPKGNCAITYTGAWWYNKCHQSQLTGVYTEKKNKYKGLRWGERFFLKKARMLIRPQMDSDLVL